MTDVKTKMSVEITFTEALLGTLPADPEIAREYVLAKHPGGVPADDEDGALAGDDAFEKGITMFARTAGAEPMLWDYQWKGLFKEACLAMIESDTLTKEQRQKAKLGYTYKRSIDSLIFVTPRQIVLIRPETADWRGLSMTDGPRGLPLLQRPLRKDSFKGGQVCLASSEAVPAGTRVRLTVNVLNAALLEYVRRWLDYGALKGLGQWRNSGLGRFEWREVAP